MRPLRLEITAFGPFGGDEVVDFTTLPGDRPFVISGRTGAGKTSIFDAMTYALYGALPGHRSEHSDVRSSFAAPAEMCAITFEFEARGQRWRVTRTPKQVRAKRRGTGVTEVDPTARLQRWQRGTWEPVEAHITDINQQCRDVIGLSAEQFQRVVLLPQGDFQKVLNARTTEREQLLRTLFGTEIYLRAVSRLTDERKRLRQVLAHADTQSRTQRREAANNIDAVRRLLATGGAAEGESSVAESAGGEAARGRSGSSPLDEDARIIDITTGEPADHEGPLTEPAALDVLRAECEVLGGQPLDSRREDSRVAMDEANAATGAAALAEGLAADVAERDGLVARMDGLEAGRAEHDGRRDRLGRADAAAPVVEACARRTRAGQRHGTAQRAAEDAWDEAVQAAAAVDRTLPAAIDPLAADAVARELLGAASRFEQVAVDADRAAALRGRERDCRAGIDGLEAERDGHHRTLVMTADRRSELRTEYETALIADAGHETAERAVVDADAVVAARQALDDARDDIARAVDTAEAVAVEHEKLSDERSRLVEEHATTAALAAVEPRAAETVTAAAALLATARRVAELTGAFATTRHSAQAADAGARDAFRAFLAGTAPRLAEELRDGQPCAVCGSTDHPHPATSDGDDAAVDHESVERARLAARSAAEAHERLATELGTLLEHHPEVGQRDVASFEQAVADARRAHAEAIAATSRVGDMVAMIDDAEERLADLEQRKIHQRGEKGDAEQFVQKLLGQLGPHAGRSLDAARRRADRARRAVEAAEAARHRLAQIVEELTSLDGTDSATRDRISAIGSLTAALSEKRDAARCDAGELEAGVADATNGHDPRSLARSAEVAAAAAGAARDAATLMDSARQSHDEAVGDVVTALGSTTFAHEAAALAAALEPRDRQQVQEAVETWTTEWAKATGRFEVLQDKGLPDVAPDVEVARNLVRVTRQVADALSTTVTAAETHLRAAHDLLEQCEGLDSAHAADRARLTLVDRVVSVLSGERTGQRVTLEAWVLSAYLREVVDAANIHLRRMSHGRYELSVDSGHVKGNAKAGLDLAVVDAHSGHSRPTASLSGGETFQAALSMALGLADVLTSQHAGLRLDALFVDEGFGSLDAEAIDMAITVLDNLRDRGSMVGVITHVEAMKESLPVAIEVTLRPDHRGSTLVQVAPSSLL